MFRHNSPKRVTYAYHESNVTRFGKTSLNAQTIFFPDLLIKVQCYRLPFIWCIIRRYSRSGFDDIATSSARTSTMKFQEKKKLITCRRMRYIELMEFPSIPEMDCKRKLSLSSSPEAHGLLNALKLGTMVKL